MRPEVGTLKEIGAKHMDLVEIVGSWNGQSVANGSQWYIWRIDGDDFYGWQAHYPDGHRGTKLSGSSQWRIVSRAKPTGPVITETVTRKRIVPGVYGGIAVTVCPTRPEGLVGIELDYGGWWDRDDLIAARDVFNQLIEALEE